MSSKKISRYKLPESITIFGVVFKVERSYLDGLMGQCDRDDHTIKIHQDLSEKEAKHTLVHEALHGALAITGQSDLLKDKHEEGLVRMLENYLVDIIDYDKFFSR